MVTQRRSMASTTASTTTSTPQQPIVAVLAAAAAAAVGDDDDDDEEGGGGGGGRGKDRCRHEIQIDEHEEQEQDEEPISEVVADLRQAVQANGVHDKEKASTEDYDTFTASVTSVVVVVINTEEDKDEDVERRTTDIITPIRDVDGDGDGIISAIMNPGFDTDDKCTLSSSSSSSPLPLSSSQQSALTEPSSLRQSVVNQEKLEGQHRSTRTRLSPLSYSKSTEEEVNTTEENGIPVVARSYDLEDDTIKRKNKDNDERYEDIPQGRHRHRFWNYSSKNRTGSQTRRYCCFLRKNQQHQQQKHEFWGLLIVLVTMFVLVVLLDNNGSANHHLEHSASNSFDDKLPLLPQHPPSSPPPPPLTEAYRHVIYRLFGVRSFDDGTNNNNADDILRDVVEPGSPQHQALVYLSNKLYARDNNDNGNYHDDDDTIVEDEQTDIFQQYDHLTFRQLVNRYVLLTIWFAWNGKDWTMTSKKQQETGGNNNHPVHHSADGTIEGWVQFHHHHTLLSTTNHDKNITDIDESILEKYHYQHQRSIRYYDIREPNSICFWTGVACRYKEIIVGIHLSSLSLSGNIMDVPELRFLQDLQQLDLSQNHLKGTIPFWWGELTNLRHLKLHGNYLSGPVPRAFMNKDIVPNLVEATFHHNDNLYGLHDFGSPPLCNVTAPAVLTSDCAGSSNVKDTGPLNQHQHLPQSTKYTPQVYCPCCNVCCTNSDSSSPLVVHYNESSSSWFPVSSEYFDENDVASFEKSRTLYPPSCINVYP